MKHQSFLVDAFFCNRMTLIGIFTYVMNHDFIQFAYVMKQFLLKIAYVMKQKILQDIYNKLFIKNRDF